MSVTNVGAIGIENRFSRRLDGSVPVSELMTTAADTAELRVQVPRAPSVSMGASVREAAHVMASNGSLQIEVRSAEGEIVGVLTASDLFRWAAGTADTQQGWLGD